MTFLNGSWGFYSQEFYTTQFFIVVVATLLVEAGLVGVYLIMVEGKRLRWKLLGSFLIVALGNLVTGYAGYWFLGGGVYRW